MSQEEFVKKLFNDGELKSRLNDQYFYLPEKYIKSETAKVKKKSIKNNSKIFFKKKSLNF